MRVARTFCLLVVCLLVSAPALAGEMRVGDIVVEKIWARAAFRAGGSGAAYLTLRNTGSKADRVVDVSSAVAGLVQIHTHVNQSGVMVMRHVEALEIPAGGTVVLKPGSDHVMLMGLKAPLKKGTRFELSLTFDKSGTVVIPVQVQKAGARSYKATE